MLVAGLLTDEVLLGRGEETRVQDFRAFPSETVEGLVMLSA